MGVWEITDGARLNWVAPTDVYLEFGGEAFSGSNFPASSPDPIGATNVYMKTGGDIGQENSWQFGLSWLNTKNSPDACSAHEHEEELELDEAESGDDHDHESAEFCQFEGERNYYVGDFTWKWAPDGNYKYQSVTFLGEYFYIEDQGEFHDDHDATGVEHEEGAIDGSSTGWQASLVYQFAPQWATGVRYSQITPNDFYADYDAKASDVMVQYMHSHFSNIRFQYTLDESTYDVKDNVYTLQYTMSLGDHGAHVF